ncbi:hypothetical protein CDD83_6855 [Cordyceps sp. RAO-2017]|nr:hypothetical protein CDD83_6855 [Cordyceps sp. RAO-2017]
MVAPRRSSRLGSGQAQAAAIIPKAAAPPSSPPPQRKRKRKATPTGEATPTPPPVTPQTKRRTKPASTPPPTTDLPRPARHATVARLADPRGTNATLMSPESATLVASRHVDSPSPSKAPSTGKATTTTKTTTQTLLQEACAHLISVDERMRPLIEKNHCRMFSPEGLAETVDPFESLASGIISQQVSGAAARSIKAKFVALFADGGGEQQEQQQQQQEQREAGSAPRFPQPSEVARCPLERLRTAGLSQRKAEYVSGLAGKFASGELSARLLHQAPYDELVERLVAVRGLGRWSVDMFACFGLKRMDVFSAGDLGVQRGMAAFVGRDVAKLKSKGGKWKYMSEREMLELSAKFAPYRSLFMWLMWRVEDSFTDVSTME